MLNILRQTVKTIADANAADETESLQSSVIKPFFDKSSVLQEVRQFKTGNLKYPQCREILVKLLYILYQGVVLTETEANDAFLNVTKLYEHQNIILKRLSHIAIRELAPVATDSLIATSSLIKDINSSDNFIKPSAMRALVSVVDKTMIGSIERYIKQALVHKYSPFCASSLVSAYKIDDVEAGKRWGLEISEAAQNGSVSCEFLSVGLTCHLRKKDRFALVKLISKHRGLSASSTTQMLLLRLAIKLICSKPQTITTEFPMDDESKVLYGLLVTCLSTRNDMVGCEVIRAFQSLSVIPAKFGSNLISIIKIQMNSARSIVRFSSLRNLHGLILAHPKIISRSLDDLVDNLAHIVNDNNRATALFAVLCLVKLMNEKNDNSIFEIVKKFMKDADQSFRVIVVKQLELFASDNARFASKFLSYLSESLKTEFESTTRVAIVKAILSLMEFDSNIKSDCLQALCEFIEDCGEQTITISVMHAITTHAVETESPHLFVKYILNRAMIDKVLVRSAAVKCLAQFACVNDYLMKNIIVLLSRCTHDSDENVRTEASGYIRLLKTKTVKECQTFLFPKKKPTNLNLLGESLRNYIINCKFEEQFNRITYAPVVETPAEVEQLSESDHELSEQNNIVTEHNLNDVVSHYKRQLKDIPQLAIYGDLIFTAGRPIYLTEEGTEYVVAVMKHFFKNALVLQFIIKNTVRDHILEKVTVSFQTPTDFIIAVKIPATSIKFGNVESCFCVIESQLQFYENIGEEFENCKLDFTLRDADSNMEYLDSYELENFTLSLNDFICENPSAQIDQLCEQLTFGNSEPSVFGLPSYKTIGEAENDIKKTLGMTMIDETTQKDAVLLRMAGLFMNVKQVVCYLKLYVTQKFKGVILEVKVQSDDEAVIELVLQNID